MCDKFFMQSHQLTAHLLCHGSKRWQEYSRTVKRDGCPCKETVTSPHTDKQEVVRVRQERSQETLRTMAVGIRERMASEDLQGPGRQVYRTGEETEKEGWDWPLVRGEMDRHEILLEDWEIQRLWALLEKE